METTEAALLIVYEHRFRDESQIDLNWLNRQNQKILDGLEWFTDNVTQRLLKHRPSIK